MQSTIGFSSTLAAKKIAAPGPGLAYKVRNFPNVWAGTWRHALARALKMNHMLGELRAVLIKADGRRVNYGLISTQLVTTAFCEFMVDQLITETSTWGDFQFHDSGIGTTGANITDTDIETTDGQARTDGTQVESTSVIYESVGAIAYDNTYAITEHGLFNISTGGTMMDHHVFAAINVVNGDSIQFSFDLTCTAGG